MLGHSRSSASRTMYRDAVRVAAPRAAAPAAKMPVPTSHGFISFLILLPLLDPASILPGSQSDYKYFIRIRVSFPPIVYAASVNGSVDPAHKKALPILRRQRLIRICCFTHRRDSRTFSQDFPKIALSAGNAPFLCRRLPEFPPVSDIGSGHRGKS